MGQVAELRLPPAKPHHRIDGQKLKVGSNGLIKHVH